jgi:hypothetical protein
MAAETRNEAIDRWREDDRLRKMSEDDLETHMEGEAKKLDTELRIEERNDYWHAAFVTFDVPSSIAPDGAEKASADAATRHEALVNLAELVEIERIRQLPQEQPDD